MPASETAEQKPHHAWLTTPTRKIRMKDRKRVRPMEVLNLGMLRTGTVSMEKALDILGIPCYHGITIFTRIADCALWNQALDAKYFNKGEPFTREQWDQLLGEFGAAGDAPVVAFAEELIREYPEAKVILVEREIESWYGSFDEAVIKSCFSPVLSFIQRLDPWFLGPLGSVNRRWVLGWFKSRSAAEMRARARPIYLDHYDLVRRITIPEGRLLEYQLGSGWGPLCQFLGKPVPDVPFPKANDLAAFKEMLNLMLWKSLRNAGMLMAYYVLPVLMLGAAMVALSYNV